MSESERKTLTDISSRAWEHPADRGALVALRKLRGFDTVVRRMSGLISERQIRLMLLGSAIRVDTRQFPRLFRIYTQAATALDVEALPDLYIQSNPLLNAMTIGLERPVIVLNSALVDVMDEDELRFILGHELGHVQSGHAVYRTILSVLTLLSSYWLSIPIAGLGYRAIVAALMEWYRKSELSADRAGLLACQDEAVARRVNMKFASGGRIDELDPDAFFEQAAEYADSDDMRDFILRMLLVETMTHPYAVVRAAELRDWIASGEYAGILSGEYPRRSGDASASMSAEADAAAASYQRQFTDLEDALGRFTNDMSNTFTSAVNWVSSKLRPGSGTDRPKGDDGPAGPNW